ncbi:hypothetical protein SAMN04515665_11932 [Blastococcus sp. DSM 46786]|uniref:hypothetical protein n=1 Tax=Blastococcus sp. DSM 46786 TaxID=1798227 RepID=UPI0008AA8BA2|nr:hypothetical protein [Blastococcus sp. DSM 46786]SEL77661.1 hypothetical protein SAMN04515665_11932 [Blastococcus sp. DSM 46786]
MHIEAFADDLALSSPTRLPVTARRSSQKVLLVLLSGRMWVRDADGRRREITGPTWVVWYPGETLEYGAHGATVHWVFAAPTGPVPTGSPRPGSLVRLRDVRDDDGVEDALLVDYLDDSPDGSGPLSVVADGAGSGIGVNALTDVLQVVDEADEDLRGWSYGPGHDHPLRLDRS